MAVQALLSFETNDEHAEYEAIYAQSAPSGTQKRTGSYSLYTYHKDPPDVSDDAGVKIVPFASPVTMSTVRFYLYITARPDGDPAKGNLPSWATLLSYEATTLLPSLLHDSAGKLRVMDNPGVGPTTGAITLDLDTWYRVEVQLDTSADTITVKVDGVVDSNLDGLSITGGYNYSWVTVGGHGALDMGTENDEFYIDDVQVRDDSTWPGAGQAELFVPTRDSNQGYTGWTPSVGGDDFAVVDEAAPTPDDADYIASSTANQKGTVRPASAATCGITGTIHAIQAHVRGGEDPVAGGKVLMNINSVDSLSSAGASFTTPTWYTGSRAAARGSVVILTGPYDTDDWDTVEGGLQHADSAVEARIHTIWFVVDYNPAEAGVVGHKATAVIGNRAWQPDNSTGKDNSMDENQATSNFGTATVLNLGRADGKSPHKWRWLVDFILSDPEVGAGNTVRQARLCLGVSFQGGACSVKATEVVRTDWHETESTWNIFKAANNWSTAGASHDPDDIDSNYEHDTVITIGAAGQFEYINVRDIVNHLRASTARIRLRMVDEAASNLRQYYSSEYLTVPRLRPILVAQVDAAGIEELSGTIAAVASLSGALYSIRALSGTVAAQAAMSALLRRIRDVDGDVDAAATLAANLYVVWSLTGTTAAASYLIATLEALIAESVRPSSALAVGDEALIASSRMVEGLAAQGITATPILPGRGESSGTPLGSGRFNRLPSGLATGQDVPRPGSAGVVEATEGSSRRSVVPLGRGGLVETPAVTNLDENPSFETDLNCVTVVNGTITRSSTKAKHGTYSCHCEVTDPNPTLAKVRQDGSRFAIAPGLLYTSSIQAQLETGDSGSILILVYWYNAAGGYISLDYATLALSDSAWTRAELAATAPSNAVSARVVVGFALSAGEAVYLDGWELRPGVYSGAYIDGDQEGCRWLGAPHASASERGALGPGSGGAETGRTMEGEAETDRPPISGKAR